MMIRFLFVVIGLFFYGTGTCFAGDNTKSGISTQLGQFKDWTAYSVVEGGKKICYIGSFPIDDNGNVIKRSGDAYVLVSAFGKHDEVNVSVPVKPGKNGISLKIDKGSKITLYSDGNMGWAIDSDTDAMLVSMMHKGTAMYISTPDNTKGEAVNKYSLMGFGAAYKYMRSTCMS